MKKIFSIILILQASNSFAVCSSPISRTNVGTGSVLTSTKYNLDVNTAYNRVNNLPGDCITSGTVSTSKIAAGAITSAKIADGAVTSAKLATGAIPEVGRLLRINAVTTSTTWTKLVSVGSVYVQVVGGGGASFGGSAGGTSSFGTHCVANGGSVPVSTSSDGGTGGTASNGDINLQGGQGEKFISGTSSIGGSGGRSMLGHYGSGGVGSFSSVMSSGGGAGGYCAKLIDAASLGATETVTVGAGGANSNSGTTPGQGGLVLIYEYSK